MSFTNEAVDDLVKWLRYYGGHLQASHKNSMESAARLVEELRAERDEAIAALAVIAEMGGKTLIHDPSEDDEVRKAYSLGAARAFDQAASVASSVVES